jgi:hypothetical protein
LGPGEEKRNARWIRAVEQEGRQFDYNSEIFGNIQSGFDNRKESITEYYYD